MICDAIVLAGERVDAMLVRGKNKIFYELEGVPLVIYTLRALVSAKNTGKIVVVGNYEKLFPLVNKFFPKLLENGAITIVKQSDTILDNAWLGFLATLPEYTERPLDTQFLLDKYRDKPVLFLSADIPLVSPEEIDYFVSSCDTKKYSFFPSFTTYDVVSRYGATETTPGIDMAYFHFREGLYRVGNLFLVLPARLGKPKNINVMYKYRYQKKLKNIIFLLFSLLKNPHCLYIIRDFLFLQSALFFSKYGMNRASLFVRRFCPPMERISEDLSSLVNGKIKVILLEFGGSAIDVDNVKDLDTMKSMLSTWRKVVESTRLEFESRSQGR